MAINRIEVAIDCDDPTHEGLEALAAVVRVFGLDPMSDVHVSMMPSDEGKPVLMAVLQVGRNQSE